jgi:FkbM family methyltransferase
MTQRTFRGLLPALQRAKYLAWRLLGGSTPITLQLNSGARLSMRPKASGDYGTAYDIFVLEPYAIDLNAPRTIVDLGGNVGYATLYLATRHKSARVHTFEPHPEHSRLGRGLMRLNQLDSRVQWNEAAAGASEGTVSFSDDKTCSQVTQSEQGMISVKMVDFFKWAKSVGPIDLLKMDIEGGEYPILADERFPDLDCKMLVMEWHVTPSRPDALKWCTARLEAAGYKVVNLRTEAHGEAGILRAVK